MKVKIKDKFFSVYDTGSQEAWSGDGAGVSAGFYFKKDVNRINQLKINEYARIKQNDGTYLVVKRLR